MPTALQPLATFEMRRCSIYVAGKRRSGRPKYWCRTHYAGAWDPTGKPLGVCPRHDKLFPTAAGVLEVNAADYPGGLGAWGCLRAVLNTTTLAPEVGIHVHGRPQAGGHKTLDATFGAVQLTHDGVTRFIDAETAISFTISNVFGVPSKVMRCSHCGFEHVDADTFAVIPHKKHLCMSCGRDFIQSELAVGNPLAGLQQANFEAWRRPTIQARRAIKIELDDWPGGIQIWGTNPALLWTSRKPEESGIHVHCYAERGLPYGQEAVDETFGSVVLNGESLDTDGIRLLMVQQHMESLRGRMACETCPSCGLKHTDKGPLAYTPHSGHDCEHCGKHFTTRRNVVSNASLDAVRHFSPVSA
jgi:hypothetical protein